MTDAGTPMSGEQVARMLEQAAEMVEAEIADLKAQLSACRAELAASNAQFDAAELFTKYSRDSGETWQQWPLAKRVELAIRVCASQNDYEERYEQSERLLAAATKDAEKWHTKATLQRRELRRLNKVLGPYWGGFRKGIGMEAECRLRGAMQQAFGSDAVRAAEIAALASKDSPK